jgi:long-chain fatty acid transport protein
MARNILKISTLALLAAASAVSAAHAGGFSRGTADTDIIFEEGNFNLRAGATIVVPTRKYTKALAPLGGSLIGTSPYETYVIPSAAIKLNVNDDLRCAGTFTQPYGGDASWVVPSGPSAKKSENFTVSEVGMTCGYKFDLAKGRAWILGGVYQDVFNYKLVSAGGALRVGLNGTDNSFALGAAYEIPEIALRAQMMYHSGLHFDATGTTQRVAATGTALDGLPLGVVLPIAKGNGDLPQSVDMRVQSGVAPGWLVFASAKWTDWSVTKALNLIPAPGAAGANLYNWRDGWTVSAGVGHQFTESFSGAASITWDRGVGTGYDLSSGTWTLGAGGALKDKMGGELKFGGGITYLSSAAETKYGPANAAVGAGWAYALGASYKTKW